MKKDLDAWWSNICGKHAIGKITDRVFRKYQIKYEALKKKQK